MSMARSLIKAAEKEDKHLEKWRAEMNWTIEMTAADIKVLKQYEELMDPFAKHTDILGGENYSTLHLVYPALETCSLTWKIWARSMYFMEGLVLAQPSTAKAWIRN